MKKGFLTCMLCICTVLCFLNADVFAKDSESIVILYENDVHCAVDGYSKLSAMKNELKNEFEHVGVVSVGDFVQGDTIGAVSKGEYIVKLMNLVGYDAITLGNHEFDYTLPRLRELNEMSSIKFISCNFMKIDENKSYFEPYRIVSYGDTDVAYIGITTPETITSAFPAQFKNEANEIIYTFNVNNLHEVVQANIDEAKNAGADYVIALSHIGYDEAGVLADITDLIEKTEGLDVVLDGHSHSVIEEMFVKDKNGEEVLVSSTGTKFAHIGKLTVSKDGFDTELIKTEDYNKADAAVDSYIAEIKESYAEVGNRKIGESKIELITHDKDGARLVRKYETNLGNFCSDALRVVTDSDVAFVNGGGMRTPLKAGDVTFNDIFSVFPFNNRIVKAEITGQVLLDMLEMGMMMYPEEHGAFPHMSGVTFSVNKSVPTSVKVDENGFFVSVDGDYRVYNVKVLNRESGAYEKLDLEKKYVFASSNYYILEFGGGLAMFKGANILEDEGRLDIEVLESYIVSDLGGVIGEEYKDVENRITLTDGFVSSEDEAVTRAEAIAALWQMDGSRVANYAMSFKDIDADAQYTEAIRWAAAVKIVNGYSENSFAPNDVLTREQLAAIILRYAMYKNADVSAGENGDISSYKDSLTVSEWAVPAFRWVLGSGIMSGSTSDTLAPGESVSRIDFASVLDKCAKYLEHK